ncbi:toprim domain-containing protein [Croceitalea sp. MTPC9]|uniref:toprim domain-containing protein n=1 Tax=unclassified Croceitalea TaxID=2632280 RepID=UPI002B3D2BBC|nr:toprim domain-containing protein [Croceitalea sp. MTPC6]GMN15977.1 toprim domain-containing protein [Croceitalea sp. MTPC9]
MKKEILNCEKARSVCLVQTLAKLGHFPNRKSEKEAWFLSPFRSETQASFKVSLRDNYWIDFGTFEGGNAIDLVVKLNDCSVREALAFLSNETSGFSFQQQRIFKKETGKLEIQKVQTIQHQALLIYLKSRKIPISIAKMYCKEVWYRNRGRTFFGIGLKNQLGGWELRNKYYKTSTSPKTYSYFNNGHQNLIVVEGMFDLLSLEALLKEGLKNNDVVTLNSVAFIKRILPFLENYKSVKLYLDNDSTGDKATEYLMKLYSNSVDSRGIYKGCKDANEKLML